MSEILKSPTRNKKQSSAFLLMFSDVTFHFETFPTNMTFTAWFMWLFIWKRNLRQFNVKSVENISRRNENHGTHAKKALGFLVPGWRFQYFRHLLQNPNLKLMASFPNNHYWSYTFLNPWALFKQFKVEDIYSATCAWLYVTDILICL